MDHNPDKGIFVEEDLAGTTIGLTAQRSWQFIVVAALAAVATTWSFDLAQPYVTFLVVSGVLGWLANQVRTDVHIGAHAFRVQRRAFSLVLLREVVAYSEVASVEVDSNGLCVRRQDGTEVRVRRGQHEDHQALLEHLEVRTVSADAVNEVPSELALLRQGKAARPVV